MAVRALQEKGIPPPGADDARVYRGVRSGFFVIDPALIVLT